MHLRLHSILLLLLLVIGQPLLAAGDAVALDQARKSAKIASFTLSKVQRWLHEVALKQIDSETGLYISSPIGSARYREALWNYDDAAADTYPFLFWAAWYTDRDKIKGPILEVLKAEQRICNHLDRIPTAVNHRTLEKVVKSEDDTIFAASEYVKDGLVAIVEVAGKDNPWFQRMRDIEDDIWKQAAIKTPYGNIPTLNLEANGDQLQVLARLFAMTGEQKYLQWAERIADYYLLGGDFMPEHLRDHGCEIIGGLGLLFGMESVHNPEKARAYEPHIHRILDEILKRGVNEDGIMYNRMVGPGPGDHGGGLNDSWGYNYVSYLCYDMAMGSPVYRDRVRSPLAHLAKPQYRSYPWERNAIDGFADAIEGGLYLINRLPVPEAITWADAEVEKNIVCADRPGHMWTTDKFNSNAIRTALIHAMMHTRGVTALPWRQGLTLGAAKSAEDLTIVMSSLEKWSGTLEFDMPRHRMDMGFTKDWPRMNTMPEWFTVEPDREYVIQASDRDKPSIHKGSELHQGLKIELAPGQELRIEVKPR